MGSVEAFPRQLHVATLADVWRTGPLPGTGIVRVRGARLEDYAAVRALHRLAEPYLSPCTLRQFESQLQAFPEGQLVAACDGQLVGAAASLIVDWDDYGVDHTWKSITGDGYFTTHDAAGRTLYAADLVVDTTRRGFGVGRALFQARRRLCRRMNLRRIITSARLPGYRDAGEGLTPELYAMRVIWGDIPDTAMRFQMSQGFQYCGILRDYQPEDAESCGHAALLAWLNPLYSPPRPPALVDAEGARKCA